VSESATQDPVLARILAYAKDRWCWEDSTMLEELYETYGVDSTPEAFVDNFARHYDLTDPRDAWF
jgi:hypothetical protein